MQNDKNSDRFSEIANDTILEVIDTIEAHDHACIIEIEVESDVVKFTVLGKQNKEKQYVLNKHNNYRQIWLVSPISGPYHFNQLQETWVDKNGVVLADLLTKELSQFIDKIKFNLCFQI